jgi:hypothetical protein
LALDRAKSDDVRNILIKHENFMKISNESNGNEHHHQQPQIIKIK